MKRVVLSLLVVALVLLAAVGCGRSGGVAARPAEIRLDYAYYSPLSLVIKHHGWMEEEFRADGLPVKWVLSLGSNKAIEYLASESADFTSTAGAAALLARSNGIPLQVVYIYSKPEWTALVTRKDSPIRTVADLKGKKVAATKGTDPYIFLLRALDTAGLSQSDIELVHLQHPDGKAALERGEVDAWAGLDPHMAQINLESGARLFFRNPDFNTYGFLNVRQSYADRYPEIVKRVLKVYEKGRKWALEHPEETARILAEAARMSPEVARQVLTRNDFRNPVPGEEHRKGLSAASRILEKEGLIKPGVDPEKVIGELIRPEFAQAVVQP